MKVINKLKFKSTKFSFRNKKELVDYFDQELIKGSKNYVNKVKEQAEENLHIIFSYHIIFQYISFILLGIAGITTLKEMAFLLNFSILCLSLLLFFLSVILKFEVDKRMFGVKLGIKMLSIDNFTLLEEQRKILIDEKQIEKEIKNEELEEKLKLNQS